MVIVGGACLSEEDCVPPAECTSHINVGHAETGRKTCEVPCDSLGPESCPAPYRCALSDDWVRPSRGDGVCVK
jgi:hypothetical protein